MKTIEEAARENQETYSDDPHAIGYDAFIGGVEFAQRWIPVEEELPENTFLFEHPNFESIRFLVTGTNGKEWIANRKKQKDSSIIPYSFFSCETGRYYSITQWRPIELK